jgi:hypothetical protein
VHVYAGAVGRALSAGAPRPDVGAAYPGYGANHGFSGTIPANPGSQAVCVYGINVPTGPNPALACASVVVPGGSPFGSVDVIEAGAGSVYVGGWAIDPDTVEPTSVHVYVGPAGFAIPASGSRPDVGQAFPLYGPSHGFSGSVPAARGPQQVCVYSINVGQGQNQLMRCQTVTVS